jgi:hypothetical protein
MVTSVVEIAAVVTSVVEIAAVVTIAATTNFL